MAKPLINISTTQAIFFACFLVAYEFLTYIANDMIMPAMVLVVATFNGPETAVATSLTAYMLGGASLQIFLGPISDCYGRRPIMLAGAILFFFCTVLIGCSNSIDQFLVARFLQGMGLCFIWVVGYATLQEIFTEMDAIRLIALMANVAIIAPLIGPLLGALFIMYFSWRLIFFTIAALTSVTIWGLWRFMPESVGQIKSDGGQIKRMPISLMHVLRSYLCLMRNKSFILGSMALGIAGLPCIIWIALAPVIIINAAQLSKLQYALWQIPAFTASIMGNIALRWLTYKDSTTQIVYKGSILLIISLITMYVLPILISDDFIWLMPGLIVYFFAASIISAPLTRIILFSTGVSKGTAAALLSIIVIITEACGIEIVNYLYINHDNTIFGLCCALAGIIYLILLMALNTSLRFAKISDN